MKPPKCKSCGKEEWRHVCGHDLRKAMNKAVADQMVKLIKVSPAGATFDPEVSLRIPSHKGYGK